MRRLHAMDGNVFRHKNREVKGYLHLVELVLHTHEGHKAVAGARNIQEQRVFLSISDIDSLTSYLQGVKAELLQEQIKDEEGIIV